MSSHDFSGVPLDVARAADMRSYGAGVIKMAVMPPALRETLPLLTIARDGDAVVVGMGDAGVPTRLLAARYGSRWSDAGNGIAPGQIQLQACCRTPPSRPGRRSMPTPSALLQIDWRNQG